MLPEVFVAKAGLPNAAANVMPGANAPQQNGHHSILDEDLDRESRLKKVGFLILFAMLYYFDSSKIPKNKLKYQKFKFTKNPFITPSREFYPLNQITIDCFNKQAHFL
jgi:hypothetical protein